MDKKVDAYIKGQASPQKEILQKLRRIILKTFPKIEEGFYNGVPWYGKYYLVGLKDHVNMGFSVSGLPKKDADRFEGRGKFMRHLKLYSLGDVDEERVVRLLRVAAKSKCASRAGCPGSRE